MRPPTTARTLVNGEPEARVSASNRGLAYGDGVFTTAKISAGRPQLWQRHLRRLTRDCQKIGLSFDREALQRETDAFCEGLRAGAADFAGEEAVLKVILTRGDGARGYRPPAGGAVRILQLTRFTPYPPEYLEQGVAVTVCRLRLSDSPALAGVKHLNRLEQVLARAEWGDEYQEGLMLDADRHVVEGTMSNVFAVTGDALLTPALDRCGVAGVMREHLSEKAAKSGLDVREARLKIEDLHRAEGVFICNALIGAWPVSRVGLRGGHESCSSGGFIAGRFRRFLEWADQAE